MVFINNFTNSRNLSDIKYFYDNFGATNLNFLFDGFAEGSTEWSVPKKAAPGDIILFMCAKEARNNLGMATSHIPDDFNEGFRNFVDQQKVLYKKYSGHILGFGEVFSDPEYDEADRRYYSKINQLSQFPAPIHIDDFRSFITISRTSAITVINEDQWERLKWTVNQKNPQFFDNVTAPDKDVLDREFDAAVNKEQEKSLDKLQKAAEKKDSKPTASTVQAKVYHRDPTIAAYVKKRANGQCQLCGMKAPFEDQNGLPYLECHHLEWLSKGGEDSLDNCVALCPNCHRRMHILNDRKDIDYLKSKNK